VPMPTGFTRHLIGAEITAGVLWRAVDPPKSGEEMDSIIPDILTAISLFFAAAAFIITVAVAIRIKTLRRVFGLISAFCLYMTGLYSYILISDPDITANTAALGRAGVTLLLAGIIMLTLLIDRWYHVR
jgi:hypothetical protein